MKAFSALLGSLALALTVSLAPSASAAACIACGDATGDCAVTAADALRVLKAAVGLPVTCPPERCDFNGDGKVRTGDALAVLKLAVGLPVVRKCPIACVQAGDCLGTLCAIPSCDQGLCALVNRPFGTQLDSQTPGDCSTAVCNGEGSETQQANPGDRPSDGNPCTDDVCSPGPAFVPKNCDDQNACTSDSCNPTDGVCVNAASSGTLCDDGDACTSGDQCSGGICQPGRYICCVNDWDCPGTLCAIPYCDQGLCALVNRPFGTQLDSQTPGDCSTAVCNGEGSETQQANPDDLPSDGNPCTDDVCAPGPAFVPNTAACDDGNGCTQGDQCSDGACVPGSQKNCDDGNLCTTDSCGSQGSCSSVPNTAACDDGNGCTVGDQCSAGQCVPGSAKNCDDENICTSDSCNPTTGACLHGASNGTACDDGDSCTGGDQCSSGFCLPGRNICNLP